MYCNKSGKTFKDNKVYVRDIRYAIVESLDADSFEIDLNERLDALEEKGAVIIDSEVHIFDDMYKGVISYTRGEYVYSETDEGGENNNGDQQVQKLSDRT